MSDCRMILHSLLHVNSLGLDTAAARMAEAGDRRGTGVSIDSAERDLQTARLERSHGTQVVEQRFDDGGSCTIVHQKVSMPR